MDAVSRAFGWSSLNRSAKMTFLLSLSYSFLLWFKPSEAYLVQWLTEEKGTVSTVEDDVLSDEEK